MTTSTAYRGVRFERAEIMGFPFFSAETQCLQEGDVKREHMRIIGRIPGLWDRPIVYSDTYPTAKRDEVYAYARHRVDQVKFLTNLDLFLEQLKGDFREINRLPLYCSLSIKGEFLTGEILPPLTVNLGVEPEKIDFLRLTVPFGDISIEFGEPIIHSKELRFAVQGALPRGIETPLFGFDATSDIWVPFFASIHWASELIPRNILEGLIRAAVRVTA